MASFPSGTELSGPHDEGFVLRFTNTGRRGRKSFAITRSQLVSTLTDLAANLSEFRRMAGAHYEETPWRTAFSTYLSDPVVNAMSTVQTLPLFHVLAKSIAAPEGAGRYLDGRIDLDAERIRSAIDHLLAITSVDVPVEKESSDERVIGGDNVLFYGAPGTGKSHAVDLRVGRERAFRTVFHPDMQNSDFVGTLKPGTSGEGKVTYEFRPGPFARSVAWAWARPDQAVYLVIEELNRAMAAAVFGELFQLLDRDAEGAGRYEVDFPSPEFAGWFEKEGGAAMKCLRLPSNLWILATMNSADQGVYPLDTAFRRRWTQEYVPIDYSTAPDAQVRYRAAGGVRQTTWRQFVEALNGFLVDNLSIGEDRLIGPRFASEGDLAQAKLPKKVLIYLWDDLLRHHGREVLFATGINTYGDIHRRLESDQTVFSEAFLATLQTEDDTGKDDTRADPAIEEE